jgi:hypothetical protein
MAAEDTQIGGNHYASKRVQPWHAMEAWMTRDQFAGFLRGNAIKYLARCDDKGGLEDLKKARHYLDKLIEFHECSNAEVTGRKLRQRQHHGPRLRHEQNTVICLNRITP